MRALYSSTVDGLDRKPQHAEARKRTSKRKKLVTLLDGFAVASILARPDVHGTSASHVACVHAYLISLHFDCSFLAYCCHQDRAAHKIGCTVIISQAN